MSFRKMHMWYPKVHRTACNQKRSMNIGGVMTTTDWKNVTCEKCLKNKRS